MREKVLLYGAGEGLENVIRFNSFSNAIEIIGIWDKDKNKHGKVVDCGGYNVEISPPQNNEGHNIIITTGYTIFNEIKKQLVANFGYKESQIKTKYWVLDSVRKEIIKRYHNYKNKEIQRIVKHLGKHELSVFNQKSLDEVLWDEKVFKDEKNGLYCTFWKDKKIYLKRNIQSEAAVRDYMRSIKAEQTKGSAHRYQQGGCGVKKGDIVVDGGAAEGFFSLDIIDYVEHIYIIECDEDWVEAIKYTFEPYKEKVTIVNKMLGDKDNDEVVTLNSINNERHIDFIKLDIEGAEVETLRTAMDYLDNTRRVRINACAYHKSMDASNISKILLDAGFKVWYSKGYIFFPFGIEIKPELRRGLILAKK